MNYNPLLMIDFYKATHADQYPKDIKKIYSPGTPRLSRLDDVKELVYFGGQGFCKEVLIKAFNENFFNRPEDEVAAEYERVMKYTLGPGTYKTDRIRTLHRLGYLPIEVFTIPEGMSTAIGVPQSVFVNTHPDFAWLTNTLETCYSAFIWHIQVSAEVGRRYRKVVEKWVEKTCGNDVRAARMIGDFSMRGQHCPESAITSSAAWLLSFLNTATVPAIMWLEDNYNCNVENEEVGFGAISTEHSVMCSNYSIDGDEITHIRRLLTEIYPNNNFSMVSDSYDYWNLVTNLLPQLKEEIMNHNGTLLIRGDSGNPVDILAGKKIEWLEDGEIDFSDSEGVRLWMRGYAWDYCFEIDTVRHFHQNGKFYEVTFEPDWQLEHGGWTDADYEFIDTYHITWKEVEPTAELLGTVWALDQIVGHTVNEKGYKVLDSHLRAIYGDSIIPDYADEAYRRLEAQGYAANNIVMGAGSMSMMALVCEQDGKLCFAGKVNGTNPGPYTRDTFGYAIKATYGEDENGNPVMIQKQPKALSWKKSPKGCIIVAPDGQSYTDGWTYEEAHGEGVENLLECVFRNGEMVKETTLAEVRNHMWPEGF